MMKTHSSSFRHRMLFPLSALCALFFLCPLLAQSATYYVATTGNDSNPGTLSQPFRSIARGVNPLRPGDTLYIRGGVWTERINLSGIGKSGEVNAWMTIAGYPGESVTLRYTSPVPKSYGPIRATVGAYFIFENLILDGINDTSGTGWAITDNNHHFILRNLEIKNFHDKSGLTIGANDIQIINCKIHDQTSIGEVGTRGYGIYYHHGNNILIEGNEIYNNPGGGMHLYSGPLNNLIVRNNSVHDNNTVLTANSFAGIILQGSATTVISGAQIYNNLIYNNGSHQNAGSGTGLHIGTHTRGTKVWNNTIYGNKHYGIQVAGSATNTVVQNNIIYQNKAGNYVDKGVGTIYGHNITTDPKFVKPDTFDFRLHAHSPGIDAGLTLIEVTKDFRNLFRPIGATYDIGAYEGGVSDFASPASPKGLSVR